MNPLIAPDRYDRQVIQGILNELFREDQRNVKNDAVGRINADLTLDGLLTLIDGQIKFPATEVTSSDANTLTDFEKGTWTPVMGDGTNNYTLSGHSGSYTKIGDTVTAWFQCPWTSIGSAGASQLRISGLPFTSASFAPAFFREMSGLDFTATLNPIIAGTSGGTQIEFFRVNDNAGQSNLAANSSSATGAVRGCVIYKV